MPKKKNKKSGAFAVGTMGEGPYGKRSHPRAYSAWLSMMQQCYNQNYQSYKAAGARGVRVCDEWLDFQAFAAWYEAHGYAHEGSAGMVLTRLMSGDDVYGPDTCMMVPRELLPALTVSTRIHRGLLGGVNPAAGHRYAAQAAGRRCEPRDTQEEARADYLEAKADKLEAETARLDAMLTDEIRAAAARRCVQLRAEADAMRAEGIRAKAERQASFEAKAMAMRRRRGKRKEATRG